MRNGRAHVVNVKLANLLSLLDLEEIEEGVYRGAASSEDARNSVFGGQIVAQAIVAAGCTIDAKSIHSLRSSFLAGGDATAPIDFRVHSLRDGRSFSTRQVLAYQGDTALCQLVASFHAPSEGYEHQLTMPDAPDPETLPTLDELLAENGDRIRRAGRSWIEARRAIEIRYAVVPIYLGGATGSQPCKAWFRAEGELSDDPTVHACLLSYASDLSLNDNALRPYGHRGPLGPQQTTSLDHSIWFHTPARADDWLLHVMESPRATAGRGYCRGEIYQRDGVHVASVVQESMMRPLGSRGGGTLPAPAPAPQRTE